MGTPQFKVEVTDYSVSVEEWRRAQHAPITELPELNELQKEVARKFGITDEEYQRNVLAGSLGRQRLIERAKALGKAVQEVLDRFAVGCRVIAVSRNIDRLGWIVRIETQKEDVDVFISQELGDDIFDSGSDATTKRLRLRVVSSLPRYAWNAKK